MKPKVTQPMSAPNPSSVFYTLWEGVKPTSTAVTARDLRGMHRCQQKSKNSTQKHMDLKSVLRKDLSKTQ